MRRDYNGLTGKEVLELFLLEIREALSKEGRLSFSQVYHNVELGGELVLTSYPHEPRDERFPIKAKAGSEAPSGTKSKTEKVTIKAVHEVPDLAREVIEENVSFITQAESKG